MSYNVDRRHISPTGRRRRRQMWKLAVRFVGLCGTSNRNGATTLRAAPRGSPARSATSCWLAACLARQTVALIIVARRSVPSARLRLPPPSRRSTLFARTHLRRLLGTAATSRSDCAPTNTELPVNCRLEQFGGGGAGCACRRRCHSDTQSC